MLQNLDNEFANLKFRSFSQSKQDLLITDVLKDKNGGYFIDLAANDWVKFSNSILLEIFNKWKGVCIGTEDFTFTFSFFIQVYSY